jgi:ribosomal protein S27E
MAKCPKCGTEVASPRKGIVGKAKLGAEGIEI